MSWLRWAKHTCAGLILAILAIFSLPASALEDATPENLKTFLDDYMPFMLEQHNFPGGVIVVTGKDQVLFSGGYGFADLETGLAADPDNTLFQPGSISKLITWTAVMQLVEQGKPSPGTSAFIFWVS